jgi:tripartite-type tricarboxylate transporter receptor subunit TctC
MKATNLHAHSFICASLMLCAGVLVGSAAVAQSYPAAPVKIIMPTGAGTGPDVIGRVAAEFLSRTWRQQVVVANHVGGAGAIGMRVAGTAPPDGYTLLQALSSSFVSLPDVQASFPFDLAREFVPIGLVSEQPLVIAATTSLGVTSLAELFALAMKRPGGVNLAVLGRGGLPHMTGEWLRAASGTNMTPVHYPGAPPAVSDVIAGRVEAIVDSHAGLQGAIAAGKVKVLAVTSARRLPDHPDLPTVAETLPGFRSMGWFALLAPPRTPESIARKVSDDLRIILGEPELQQRYRDIGAYPRPMSQAELMNFILEEQQLWKPVIAQIGLGKR